MQRRELLKGLFGALVAPIAVKAAQLLPKQENTYVTQAEVDEYVYYQGMSVTPIHLITRREAEELYPPEHVNCRCVVNYTQGYVVERVDPNFGALIESTLRNTWVRS